MASRDVSIERYAAWLRGDPRWAHLEPERREWILRTLPQLEGLRLGCVCKPENCHGDVLVALFNEAVR